MPTIWFGKHKGLQPSAIPTSYLTWLMENADNQRILQMASHEASRRGLSVPERARRQSSREFVQSQQRAAERLQEAAARNQASSDLPNLASLIGERRAWVHAKIGLPLEPVGTTP